MPCLLVCCLCSTQAGASSCVVASALPDHLAQHETMSLHLMLGLQKACQQVLCSMTGAVLVKPYFGRSLPDSRRTT